MAQVSRLDNVPDAFMRIPDSKPVLVHFYNTKHKVPEGGHLQGVQAFSFNGKEHLALTGSSGSYSYYVTAPVDSEARLVKLLDSPYRHAGGCQLAGDMLYVGVEDNVAKDKAKVIALNIDGEIQGTVAERKGRYKRSTAGATAVIKVNWEIIAVCDWDSKHIDFYLPTYEGYGLQETYTMPDTGVAGAYQSINLVADTAGHIFMIGFCKAGSTNRADLFSVDANYQLTLLSSRYFKTTNGCSFRYGAGLRVINKNTLAIYTCQRALKRKNAVNVFTNRF
ncbi:MAG TPA: hypothetical protein VK154_11760 [Chitinophagales bacterium]|nr:hypothetical protein [Chitinophagales bacterium]